jgi:DNA-binding response OmpR family regulator
LKTLIVDNEPDLVVTLERVLRPLGHHCLTAHTRPEAIALIDRERPALLVVDLRVLDEEEDGLAIMRHAQGARPPPALILTSGQVSPKAGLEARQAGAIALPKPFSLATFLETVQYALARPGR